MSTSAKIMPASARKSHTALRKGERVLTPEILEDEREEKFLKSLHDFIEHERRYLLCPVEGPSELRYVLYRSVFNKVIARSSSSYKRVLLSIKTEYDDIVRAIGMKQEEIRDAQQTLKASSLKPLSIETCLSRAASLRERVSVLHEENAKLQQEIERQKLLREQSTWIPGLTVAESVDPELLDKHLERLRCQRAALLDEKSGCVSVEVKIRLNAERRAKEQRRDQMEAANRRLKLLYKRLRSLYERLCSWREAGQSAPLEELLTSVLEEVAHTAVTEDDLVSIDTELLESEEPTGVDEAEYLTDYLDRFVELFESAMYKDAARHAAHSPHGLLRNLPTVHMFKAVHGPPGSPPPLLLLFHSLLMTLPGGHRLPQAVSCEGVQCALEQGDWSLLTHALHFHKLSYSEGLGDVLTEHAQTNVSVYHTDMLLAMATVNYQACGAHMKAALSMCRRGLTLSSVELMRSCEELTPEDYMWVLCHSPSLSLLQRLTSAESGASMLPLGVVCAALLSSEPQLQECALQLLDSLVRKGQGVLEASILADSGSAVDDWNEIAEVCSSLKRADLTHRIMCALLSQSGTELLCSDPEGALLTQHIFM
uniref:Clathrin heavy chain linker domain containing 1 n=1 Tax=Neogobius melanostomus TaxID=47308 RepID=A0A8C6WEC0_9GOBI